MATSFVAQSVDEYWIVYAVIAAPPVDTGAEYETVADVSVVVETTGTAGREGLKVVARVVIAPLKHPCAQYCQASDSSARILSCNPPT